MSQKSQSLFVVVVSTTIVLMIVGGLIGLLADEIYRWFSVGVGGVFGVLLGAELAYRKGLFEADWDRLVGIGPVISFVISGGLAFALGANGFLVILTSILGGGFGALLTKYLLRFFIVEPPLSIK